MKLVFICINKRICLKLQLILLDDLFYRGTGPQGIQGEIGATGPTGPTARCNKSSIYIFKW